MVDHESEGLTRREALKRGLKLGAVLWVTPVVQVVGMRPAFAQTTSPACTVWYAVKIDPSANPVFPHCVDIFGQNNPNGVGQCLDVDDVGMPVNAGGCAHVTSSTTPDGASWTATLGEGCEFVEGSGRCFVKLGQAHGGCEPDPGDPDVCDWDSTTGTLTFNSSTGTNISHVEFAFCCDH